MFDGALAACAVLPLDAWTSMGMDQAQLVSSLQAAAKATQLWKEHQDKLNSVEAAKVAAETAEATAMLQEHQRQQQQRHQQHGEAVITATIHASDATAKGVASVPGVVAVGDDTDDGIDAALDIMDTDERFADWSEGQRRGFAEQVLGAAKRRKVDE